MTLLSCEIIRSSHNFLVVIEKLTRLQYFTPPVPPSEASQHLNDMLHLTVCVLTGTVTCDWKKFELLSLCICKLSCVFYFVTVICSVSPPPRKTIKYNKKKKILNYFTVTKSNKWLPWFYYTLLLFILGKIKNQVIKSVLKQ